MTIRPPSLSSNIRRGLQRVLGINGLADDVRHLSIDTAIAAGFAKAAATASRRLLSRENPLSWEFSGFSQHGEDGIVDYLLTELRNPRRFFVEIGAADGLENCTAWLALAHGYRGIMIEGDRTLAGRCVDVYRSRNWNVHVINQYATPESVRQIVSHLPFPDIDLLSVDVDGVDYYLVSAVMEAALRPKILVLEYNSTFGPDATVTVAFDPLFDRWKKHASGLYYGASISAYVWLLKPLGYQLVTVESSGTNAIFVNTHYFEGEFLSSLSGQQFLVNRADRNPSTFTGGSIERDGRILEPAWHESAELLSGMPVIDVRKAVRQEEG